MNVNRFVSIVSSVLIFGTAIAAINTLRMATPGRNEMTQKEAPKESRLVPLGKEHKKAMALQSPRLIASAVSSSLLFYEDFESVTGQEPYDLPTGWTSVANPKLATDFWRAGLLYSSTDGQLLGSSGEKYAFILPDMKEKHDAWMFTPAVLLEGGKDYKFQAQLIMLANYGANEELEVYLCSSPDGKESSIVKKLLTTRDECKAWTPVVAYINAAESGNYYIGFHACAEAASGGLLVDDVYVVDLESPVFYAPSQINFDTKYDVVPAMSVGYTIWNDGYTPLEVSVKECSPEISVAGLPATIDAEGQKKISITLDVNTPGLYQGHITFATNDPMSPEITIAVTQQVNEVLVGTAKRHTFDNGTPDTWRIANNNLIGVGTNGSRGLSLTSMHGLLNPDRMIDIYTDFVDMGDSPRLQFAYRLYGEDVNYRDNGYPVAPDVPKMVVYLTDDYDQTWQPVYVMEPGGENEHVAVKTFREIDIDLSKYAGKRCRARIAVGHASDEIMDLLDAHFGIIFDNISFGSQYKTDLSVVGLYGDTNLKSGQTGKYRVVTENIGNQDSPAYTISVVDENNAQVTEFSSTGLGRMKQEEFSFNWKPTSAGAHTLSAIINLQGDEDTNDNRSLPLHIAYHANDNTIHEICTQRTDSIFMGPGEPINFFAFSNVNANLYYANELGINRGEITSMIYNVQGDDYKSDNFKIYLKETSEVELSHSMTFKPEEMTLVFDGAIHFPKGTTDMVIPFNAPYQYKGGNIIVYLERFGKEFVYGRNGKMVQCTTARALTSEIDEAVGSASDMPAFEVKGRYAAIKFNMIEAPTGVINGVVKDSKGNPVVGANVIIENEASSKCTRSGGSFVFPKIAEGTYKLTASYPGYGDASGQVSVTSKNTSNVEIILTEIAKQPVSGIVKDSEGNPVCGANIEITGLNNATCKSDAEGKFSTELYGDNNQYHIVVTQPYYTSLRADFKVADKPMNLTCTVGAYPVHPDNTVAAVDGGSVAVSWDEPLIELRHDTGVPVDAVGLDYGFEDIIFGSAYHEKATVKEVSWYTFDQREHNTFNVFVFGLTDGLPDGNKILYMARDVEWKDNEWSSHKLTTPVTADGFMVAVSCNGHMCLGLSQATPNDPYIPNTEFYAGDSYRATISELSKSSNLVGYHFMIRAGVQKEGLDANLTRPSISRYDIYRYSDDKDEWTLAGKTSDKNFKDDITKLDEGRYRWGIEASYDTGISRKGKSNILYIDSSGIDDVVIQDFAINYDKPTGSLNFSDASVVAHVAIYNLKGNLVFADKSQADSIGISTLSEGMYVVAAYLKDGSVVIKKVII